MSQTTFTFRTVTSRKVDYEVADHSIEKKESRKLSRFQALGYLLCWVDALAEDESDPGRSISAIFGFDGEVAALGFDRYDPVHILTAPNWKTRMLAAWCVLGAAERAIAKQLDYGDLHNYWPNTDFCSPGFDDEATQWVSSVSAYDDPAEFNICAYVGSPARPQLIFKLESADHSPG
ncbi:hypothetical protein [Pseudomonas savastanoi]|uniref:Uncharacterized protein n=1 Tax=Pseudomonas savastanoi TaxID=29438 RepID=A0A3M6AEB7_PSESS|nr:hypothetical protein [Pseudomonas savastanoi]KPX08783.1 Uncharacterized protein ALO74_02100 [Pseudomonas syringae pv. cunninghamiae]RMV14976.1 hypothetical protein ALP17_102643 [Pseudomonas savastanoi]RMV17605.1 hypothetical protein ALP15_01178 [Pseudomonas savastanoi]RMV20141.1 hypothetical protein ALP16_02737 [Pseudomonas savastanoi]